MKKCFVNSFVFSALILAMFLFLPVVFSSCKNELLEPPDFSDRGAYVDTTVATPEGVSATQGGFRSITVSWQPVANAVKYEVYTSKIATGTFEKTTETNGSDKVSVTLGEDSDVLTYYRIKAYDKNGNSSEFSKMCHGSTLAAPIITNVIQDSSGKSATVKWFGGQNCSEDTYQGEVMYTVILYVDSEGETEVARKETTATEWEFTGLTPKTIYYYQVQEYLKDAPNNKEVSAIVDKETARRLIPNAVEELVATQGTSAKAVDVSFVLPSFVDVKESGEIFAQKPLYFEISRAEIEYTASDELDAETGRKIYKEGSLLEDYKVIAIIKSGEVSETRDAEESEQKANAPKECSFDCATGKGSAGITVEKPSSSEEQGEVLAYMPGYKLTFTDDTAVRSMTKTPVYSYKITSYADTEKKITSDESVSKTLGWLVDIPKVTVDGPLYGYKDESKKENIIKITVKFSGSIEEYGKGYTYIVTQSAVDLTEKHNPIQFDGKTEQVITNGVASKLENLVVEYDLTSDALKEGYYSYNFYITPEGTTADSTGEPYDVYRHPRKITVVKKVESLPKIENFEVEDGYSDKFVVKWKYNEYCSYSLNWTPVVDGIEQKRESMDLVGESEETVGDVGKIESVDENGIATFNHSALSGDVRKYSITVTSVYNVEKEFEKTSYTLGTAAVSQVGYEYDKITVEWPKVQKADAYSIKAYYADDTKKENALVNVESTTDTRYVLSPDDYTDATKAGKEIQFYVEAKNGKSTTTTQGVPTCLLGPAMLDTMVNKKGNGDYDINSDYITLSWKKVPGAQGYLINRVMYSVPNVGVKGFQNDVFVTYYYDASDESNTRVVLSSAGDAETGTGKNIKGNDVERVEVRETPVSKDESRYVLYDRYAEPGEVTDDGADTYKQNQSKIVFGIPFGYVVIPVLEKDDFKFDGGAIAGKVAYTALPTEKGATIGYGMRVAAQKAENENYQKVEWNKPYYNTIENGERGFRPVLYKRGYGQTANEWTRVRNLQKSDKELFVEPKGTERKFAVEYAVKYVASSGTAAESLPLSYMNYLGDEKENRYDDDYKSRGIAEEEKEPLNKGYLFTTGFTAQYGGTIGENGYQNDEYVYSELITIDDWDFKEKMLGPKRYTLEILNLDYNDKKDADGNIIWEKITELDDKLNNNGGTENDNLKIKMEVVGNEIYLMPSDLQNDDGVSKGVLKVLRSGRHYYRLKVERSLESVEDILIGGDRSVYAYRQITAEEMVRAATLAMAIGAKATGTTWSQGEGSNTSKDGSVSISTSGGAFKTNLVHKLTYTDYTPFMTTKSGENVSFLTISGNVTGETWTHTLSQGTSGNNRPPYEYHCYNNDSITVSSADSDCTFYSARIIFNLCNYETNYRDEGEKKGIKIAYPSGTSEKVFGNITPLPFAKTKEDWKKRDNIDFQQDKEEWK